MHRVLLVTSVQHRTLSVLMEDVFVRVDISQREMAAVSCLESVIYLPSIIHV